MSEYLALGYMKLVTEEASDEFESCYLSHHCVFKHSPAGSKLRVVFDGSCVTEIGLSLNDCMLTGSVVQHLTSIFIRFCTFKYIFIANIIKMYRQIKVDPSQTRYQRIFWRDNNNSKLEVYELSPLRMVFLSSPFLLDGSRT